jgi:hypothetical protein
VTSDDVDEKYDFSGGIEDRDDCDDVDDKCSRGFRAGGEFSMTSGELS